ncbi:MAG TPA: hypothetical protein PLE30_05690 [Candidatus Kapabacteria bacterium]|nr:hypothetical protein [Candidatus Kapabacteria bacterium]
MKKIILIFVIFSLNICYSQWEKTNWRSDPEIEEVFANENYIIIEGSRQLFASADFGKTWQKINIELPESHRIKSVVFIDNNIYLGDNMGNIFVSEDFGNSVTKINDGMQAKFIIGLYSDNGLLYGHASKTYIYMSDDLGLTWDSIQVVPDQWIKKMAVNGKIIVANTSNGLYISTNSGKTWQKRENGIESTRDISQIDNIHFSDNNIIISTDSRRSYYDSMALYSSSDYGVTWVKRGGDLLKSGRKNSVVASSGIVYLASANELYYSNDTCKTWTATNGKLPFNYGFHSIACYKDSVYVAMGGELYSSYKDGANWQLKKTGQKYGGVTAMSVVGDRLLIGAGYGWMNESKFNIFSSSDYGLLGRLNHLN